jgi:putative flavoprotein involved in K+ transport
VTDRGVWRSANVVIATGYCDRAFVPEMAARLAPDVRQVVPTCYRNPAELPGGGVLVVGASASGIQLADEIHASGRPVTLAVGRHTRLPRRYRGRDILWWLDDMGLFDQCAADVHDLEIAREQPSLQLVGRPDHESLDLRLLESRGVRLTGRLVGIDGHRVVFDDDLVKHTAGADVKLAALLQRIDLHALRRGLASQVAPGESFTPFLWPAEAPGEIDLRAEGIRTVVWATGFKRSYPWLAVPVLDARGEIRHEAGVTPAPGLYVLGLGFQKRRKSAFIDGVGDDAREIAEHIRARDLRLRSAVVA